MGKSICKCPQGQKFNNCSIHSKIKMRFMLKRNANIATKNTVFYNKFSYQHKSIETIIDKMIKNLEPNFRNQYNCILFYNNFTGQEIYRV